MNGWDLFTWIMAVVLGAGSLIVFGFFLRDVGQVWRGATGGRGQADPPSSGDGTEE